MANTVPNTIWICGCGISHNRVPEDHQPDYVCGFGCGLTYGESAPAKKADAPATPSAAETLAKISQDLAAAVPSAGAASSTATAETGIDTAG